MIDINVTGLKEALNFLNDMQVELAGDKGKLYQDLGQIVHDSINENFVQEGRPSWMKRKEAKKNKNWPVLDETGLMKDDALYSALQPWRKQSGGVELEIITPVYGEVHQHKGVKRNDIDQPVKRKFVDFTADELKKMNSRILQAGERG